MSVCVVCRCVDIISVGLMKLLGIMAQSKIEHLKQVEQQLMIELEKVRDLIGFFTATDVAPAPAPARTVTHTPKATHTMRRTKKPKQVAKHEGKPKRDTPWEKYVVDVLRELGGKGKTVDVIAYVTKANPKISETTIYNAVRAWLSKLNLNGVIDAEVTQNKKEGYTYKVKQQSTVSLFGSDEKAA